MRRVGILSSLLVLSGCRDAEPPAASAAPGPVAEPAPAAPPEDPEQANKPPPIQPITGREWAERVREYEEKAGTIAEIPDRGPHLKLARWAYDNGLEDEAWEQWILSLDLDGAKEEVWEQMGFGLGEHGPYPTGGPAELNEAWLKTVKEAGRAYSFRIAIQDDAPAEFFDDLSWRVRRMNWFLWRATEGQVFLDEVEIIDKETDGRFVIEAGKLGITLLDGGGAFCANPGTSDWKVIAAGKVYVRILAHEMLHGIFGLPDERHGCACIMQGGLYGIRSDQLQLCDASTHRPDPATPTSCWELAIDRFEDMKHPNPAEIGAPPDVRLKLVDR